MSLRTMAGTVLASRHPMLLWWGEDLVQLYNDAFRPILGDRHPEALGANGRRFWAHSWEKIGPHIEAALSSGNASGPEDAPPLASGSEPGDEGLWTHNFSPVPGEGGEIAGVLLVIEETTQRVQAEARLRESLAIRSIAGGLAQVGGWVVDLEEGTVDWTDEVYAIHEVPKGTRIPLEEGIAYYVPEHRDIIQAHFEACANEGVPYDLELEILTRSGRRRWIRTIGEPVRGPDGTIQKVQGAFQDISDHRAVRARSEHLAHRMSEILESITDAVFTLDRRGRFTFLNQEAERLLERSADKLIGSVIWEEFPEEDQNPILHAFQRAVSEEEAVHVEEWYPPLDRWFSVRIFPSAEGLTVYFQDISGRKTAEAALRASMARFREQASLLDVAKDAILVMEMDNTIVYWNRSAARLYGWNRAEAIGQSATRLMKPEREAFESAMTTVVETGEWAGEIEEHTRNGSPIVVDARWTLIRDAEGEPQRILVAKTDLTERKKLEAQYLRAQRLESIGTLAGGIAHDLNNVLGPIMMSIQLLKIDVEDDQTLEILETIEGSAMRGAAMVKQVLSFARGLEGTHLPVHLAPIVAEVGGIIRETFPKNLRYEEDLPEGLWKLSADATQIHQVLLNLSVNARDAMPEGGTLGISAQNVEVDEHYALMGGRAVPGPYLRIEVTDSGVGIPHDDLEQIFDPFFTTKGIGEGTGLGLPTAQAIVRSHQGFMNVYSEPGEGTTFTLYLPAEPLEVSVGEPVKDPVLPRGKDELILIVDDEQAIRSIMRQTLEAFGYRVLTARHGAEAVELYSAQGETIDLVLTDIMMPVMDGHEAIEAIRGIDPAQKIIATSGLTTRRELKPAEGDEAGLELLRKPFTAETLLTTIAKALAEGP